MNKIFKVVWSKVKHCYVVVSEIAKNTTSGGARRCRMGKVSLAAAMAAAVLTGSFAMPNSAWADAIALADRFSYIAIADNINDKTPDSDYENKGYKLTPVQVMDENGLDTGETVNYWVQEGYVVYAKRQNAVIGDSSKYVVYKVIGAKKREDFDPVASIQVHDEQTSSTTVINSALEKVTLNPFGGVTNAGGVTAPDTDHYVLNRNTRDQIVLQGPGNAEEGTSRFYDYFKTEANGLVYIDETQSYVYNNQTVNRDSVYFIGGQAGVFVIGGKVYDGVVYGNNGETLVTGQQSSTDGETTLITYWGAEIEDYNLTVAASGLTVGNLKEAFDILKGNDDELSASDVKEIKITPNDDKNGGNVDLLYNDARFNNGVSSKVSGTLSFAADGGTSETGDTYIRVSQGNTSFDLQTGSKVVANDGERYDADNNTLSTISINGNKYVIAAAGGTGTMSSWTAKVGDATATIGNGDELKFEGGSNVSLGLENKTITINATDYHLVGATEKNEDGKYTYSGEYSVGTDGKLVLNVQNGTDPVAEEDKITITGLVTKSALEQVQQTANAGWKLAVNDDTDSYNVKPEGGNDSIRLKATNGNDSTSNNLTISRNGEIVTFNFSDTPSFTSVSVGGVVDINDSGVTIENGDNDIVFSKTNISVGSKQIHNVDAGTVDTDAVNFGQLKSYVADNDKDTITELNEGKNGSVTVTKDVSGKYTVSGVDTKYKVDKGEVTADSNQVDKWIIKEEGENGQSVGEIVDTDTKILSGKVGVDEKGKYSIQLQTNEPNGNGGSGNKTIDIVNLHDYYTSGVSVNGSNNDANVQFNRNDGSSYNVNFTAGGGTYNDETKKYEDSYVKISADGSNEVITLSTGSVVRANSEANGAGKGALYKLAINGEVYTVATSDSVTSAAAAAKTVVLAGKNVDVETVVKNANGEDGHTEYTVNAKKTIVTGDGNVVVGTPIEDTNNHTITYGLGLADTVTIGSDVANKVTIDGTNGMVTGLNNTTWNAESIVSGRAATEDQLKLASVKNGNIDGYTYGIDSNGKNITGTSSITLRNADGTEILKLDGLKDTTLVSGEAVKTTSNNYENIYKVVDTQGNEVVINDVASAEKVSALDTRVGDAVFTGTNYANSSNNVTGAIIAVDTKVKEVWDNTVKSGEVNHTTGKIELTTNAKATVEVGQLRDYAIQDKEVSVNGSTATLTVKDRYSNDSYNVNITGIAGTSALEAAKTEINNRITNITNGNAIKFNTIGGDKLGLVDANGDDLSSVTVTSQEGTGGLVGVEPDAKDATITFTGTNNTPVVVSVGSTVSGELNEGVLTAIKINGKTYDLFTASEQKLSVSGSDHGWTLTDSSDGKVYVDTTLDKTTTVTSGDVENGYSFTVADTAGAKITVNDIASASKLNEIKNVVDIHAKQLTGTVMYDVQGDSYNYNSIKLGESNTTNYDPSNKSGGVKVTNVAYADDTDGSAAVNVDLLNDKISAVATEAAKATTVSGDANVTVQESGNNNSGKNYAVSLNNDITLSTKDKDNSETGKVEIKSSDSTISVGKTKEVVIDGGNSKITVGTDSDHQVVIDGGAGTIIAGQKVAIDGSVGDATFGEVRIDGTTGDITAGKVQIDGDGGTITGLTNTTWNPNSITPGQAATEDQLQQAVTQMQNYVSSNDQHIDYSKSYSVVGDKITLDVVNSGSGQVVIDDVASATALNNEIAERIAADEALNQVNERQDDQISNLQAVNDRQDTQITRLQEDVAQEVIDRQANDIVSGKIDTDGTITLTKGDSNTITVGKVSNHVLDEDPVSVKEDGTITLTATNAYDATDKKSVTISDVASKTTLDKEIERSIAVDQAIINYTEARTNQLDSRINQLGSKVNKVGAGAAALAALHPMDFDPDDKLSFAVGAGNYAGETATALGAFYRPNEKVMMNVAGTYGNGENMVNMGVSFALDRTNNVSNSRTAMAREIVDLREQVATQGQQIAQLVALVNQLAGVKEPVAPTVQPFPDVPANHWAYEYLNNLVAMGVIEGYPDGTFGGDRTMTRYEFATMLFKAMQNGAVLSEQIRQEFNAELGRIRVDRIKGADDDANKIERVRVNNYEDRDDYGSKIVMVSAGK